MVKAQQSFATWLGEWMSKQGDTALQNVRSLESARTRVKQSIEQYTQLIEQETDERHKLTRQTYLSMYKEELKVIERKLRAARKLLKADPASDKVAEALYKKLVDHPMIASVIVKDNQLHIATQDLPLEVEGWLGKTIGRFRIRLTQARFEWFMENMDWLTFNRYDRPHIREGKACLGQYEAIFKQCEREGKLYELVDSMIYFLRTAYTSEDCYIQFDEWFEHRDEVSESRIGVYEDGYDPADDEDYQEDW